MLYFLLASLALTAGLLLLAFKVAVSFAWSLLAFSVLAAFVAWVEGRRDRF